MNIAKYLMYLTVLLIPLGELGRIRLGVEGVNTHLFDFLLPVVLFIFILGALGIKRKLYFPPLTLPIASFLFVCVLSLLFALFIYSPSEVLVASLYLIRFILYSGLYFVTYNLFKGSDTKPLLTCMIISSVVIALAGFVQFVLIPDFSEFAEAEGWDPHQQRVLSTFFDPNFLAAYFVLVLSLLFGIVLYSKDIAKNIPLLVITLTIFVAFILTFSRSGYLAFASVILVVGILRSRLLLFASVLAMLLSVAFVPRISERIVGGFNIDESASARVRSWQNAMIVFQDHPILGVGFNTYRYTQERYGFYSPEEARKIHSGAGSDSSLLLVLATTGLVGVFAFVLIFVKESLLALQNFTKQKMLGLVTLLSIVSMVFSSQFNNVLFFPQIMAWYFMLFALNDLEYNQHTDKKRNSS